MISSVIGTTVVWIASAKKWQTMEKRLTERLRALHLTEEEGEEHGRWSKIVKICQIGLG